MAEIDTINKSGIYIIENLVNGKLYVGSAVLSEEHKQARRDFRHTEESKAKIASRKGWNHSEESKLKMSLAKKRLAEKQNADFITSFCKIG